MTVLAPFPPPSPISQLPPLTTPALFIALVTNERERHDSKTQPPIVQQAHLPDTGLEGALAPAVVEYDCHSAVPAASRSDIRPANWDLEKKSFLSVEFGTEAQPEAVVEVASPSAVVVAVRARGWRQVPRRDPCRWSGE